MAKKMNFFFKDAFHIEFETWLTDLPLADTSHVQSSLRQSVTRIC